MAPDNISSKYTEDGFLTVHVTTARGTIPLVGTTVTISTLNDGKQELFKVLTTDQNGQTEKVPLPAPPRTLSLSPGNEQPYSTYTVEVDLNQYASMAKVDVPIFSGVVAVLPFDMQPIIGTEITGQQKIIDSKIPSKS